VEESTKTKTDTYHAIHRPELHCAPVSSSSQLMYLSFLSLADPYHQETMGPDTIVVRTMLLDQGASFEPHAEIYGKAKMPWEKEVANTFAVMPPS